MVASELGTPRAHAITKGCVRPRQARDCTYCKQSQGEGKWEQQDRLASRWQSLACPVPARCWNRQIARVTGSDGGSPVILRSRVPNLPRKNLRDESGGLSLTQLGDDKQLDMNDADTQGFEPGFQGWESQQLS